MFPSFFKSAFLIMAIVGLVACSGHSYEYSVNGCSTGNQSFDSKEELCQGLRSTSRNKGCALSERQDRFNNECGGSFSSTP